MTAQARPSEDDLIARLFAPLAGDGALGLRDDCAQLAPPDGSDLVLTVDAIVAGVHFFPDDPPASIGRKALGVNLSDLAAKGADPLGFLLTLALPDDWTLEGLEDMAKGLGEASRAGGCPLLGGDTVRAAGPLSLSVTAIGAVPKGRMVHRFTARPGDLVCVTGTIGDAALGLALRLDPDAPWARTLAAEHRAHLADRYLHPQPRTAIRAVVREHARAAMDVSDGLAGDLAKMARVSGVSAEAEVPAVPLSEAARAALAVDPTLIERVLTGGDDYEILCAVPPEREGAFLADTVAAGIPAAVIGSFTDGSTSPVFRDAGRETRYERGSFSHF